MTQTGEVQFSQSWRRIFKIGGAAVLIALVFFRRNYAAELTAFKGFGLFEVPETLPVGAEEWFTLLRSNLYIGLSLLDLWDIFNYGFLVITFVALYGALKENAKILMSLAMLFSLAAFIIFALTNQAINIFQLSNLYYEASTEGEQSLILASADAALAIIKPGSHSPGVGYNLSSFLIYSAGLIPSIIMVRSDSFSRFTGISGILTNGIGLIYFIFLFMESSLYWIPPMLSAPFRIIWYILIAKHLFRFGKTM